MSDKKKKDTLISIRGLRELKYSYQEPAQFYPEFEQDKSKTEAQIKMNYSWNIKEEQFGIFTEFLLKLVKEDEVAIIIDYLCVTDFQVSKLSTLLSEEGENGFTIDQELEESLAKMAIAHGRGMLLQKTSLTSFRGVVFPLVDINKILLSKNPGSLNPKVIKD